MGYEGWQSITETLDYIPNNIFTIADAKRGDIGNTSSMYGRAFFKKVILMLLQLIHIWDEDSVTPFLDFKNKWVILLALTSNNGSLDFQNIEDSNGKALFKRVLENSKQWV